MISRSQAASLPRDLLALSLNPPSVHRLRYISQWNAHIVPHLFDLKKRKRIGKKKYSWFVKVLAHK